MLKVFKKFELVDGYKVFDGYNLLDGQKICDSLLLFKRASAELELGVLSGTILRAG